MSVGASHLNYSTHNLVSSGGTDLEIDVDYLPTEHSAVEWQAGIPVQAFLLPVL